VIPGSGFFEGLDAADGEFILRNGLVEYANAPAMKGLYVAKFYQSTDSTADGVARAAVDFCQLVF
jgi:hypothetical protein